ncbi:hypothetical protein Tco_0303336 [Tanacetum coccineum]
MESQSETTQTVSALKLPVLKTEDYDLWSIRMEQYLTHTDYALWEVIVNGDAPAIASASAGTEGPIPPKTAKQKLTSVPATENSPAVPKHTTVETILNMSPANKAHFESEKEAIHMILTGIRDEIYSIVVTPPKMRVAAEVRPGALLHNTQR